LGQIGTLGRKKWREGREEELGEYNSILTARRYHWIVYPYM
jgi:hypothetical protein